ESLHELIALLEQTSGLEDHVDQEERHHRDDRERDRRQERQLHRRPEVHVDQAQAHLLATGLLGGFPRQLVGYCAHAFELSSVIWVFGASPGTDSSAASSSRARSLFRAMARMRSSSSGRAKMTPMVSRPVSP